ncbi:beta strand repeat-containing protein [Ralstonia syzygii subsp. celebesensis]
MNTTSIQNVLNSGGSVTITTSGAGTQEGNIALNGNITKTAGGHASLALIADGRITTNASSSSHRTISSTSGALDVSMSARATTSASNTNGIGLRYVDISANGGNISATASGAQSATVAALDLENSTWSTTGSGSITLSGVLPSNGNSQGVYLKSTTLTTASGAITVSGTSGGIATITGTNSNGAALFSTANIGVDLAGANTLQSTGGGDITLSGTATGATATWAGSGVTLAGQNTLVTTGALTINGTASNPVSSVYRNQLSTVAIVGSGSSATNLTGGTVSITGTNSVVGNSSSTSNSNAAVKLDGKVNLTATAGPISISGSNTGGDGVWGSGSGAVSMSAPASSSININALSLDSVSGYSGFYIGGGSTLTFGTAAPVSITAQSLVSARRALWNKGGLITPGNLSIVATGGAIADDTTHGGYFQVGGTTSINSSGAGNAITLTNSGNAFNGALSLTAGIPRWPAAPH